MGEFEYLLHGRYTNFSDDPLILVVIMKHSFLFKTAIFYLYTIPRDIFTRIQCSDSHWIHFIIHNLVEIACSAPEVRNT